MNVARPQSLLLLSYHIKQHLLKLTIILEIICHMVILIFKISISVVVYSFVSIYFIENIYIYIYTCLSDTGFCSR